MVNMDLYHVRVRITYEKITNSDLVNVVVYARYFNFSTNVSYTWSLVIFLKLIDGPENKILAIQYISRTVHYSS
jgi:uncharacterized membrane protein